MSFIPRAQEIYKHFKGGLYQIVTVAEHSETGEKLVIYQAMYGEFKIYARPLQMFTERVDREKYPEAAQKFRFERQEINSIRQKESEKKALTEKKSKEYLSDSEPSAADEQTGIKSTTGNDSMEKSTCMAESDCRANDDCPALDAGLLAFLDAASYGQRLSILAELKPRITDEMLTTMAIACDVAVADGSVEERYASLRSCLLMQEKYECSRLR